MSASSLRDGDLLPPPVRSALWLGHQLGHARTATCPSGFPALDAELPDRGWPMAGLTELLLAEPGCGELALLAPALARVAGTDGIEVVWVAPVLAPFAPALRNLGVPLERFTWIAPTSARDAAWAVEQVLRSGTPVWVQWWGERVPADVLRRLHLAALDHHCPLLLLRERTAQQQASPAPLRLACTPLPGRHLSVRIIKRRGPALALPITLALPDPVPPSMRSRRHPAALPSAEATADVVAGHSPASLAA